MQSVDVTVRSPTAGGWLVAAAGIIGAGEIFYEVRKPQPAEFFHVPFSDTELWPWIVGLLLIGVLALAWILWQYVRPGRLTVDSSRARLVRVRRRVLRRHVFDAPLDSWSVRLQYFSADQRSRGQFKKLELAAPGFHEVLLYTDMQRGDELARALEGMSGDLHQLAVEVQSEPPAA